MVAKILGAADELEENVRKFLADNPEGGRFRLPDLGMNFLAIPLMIDMLQGEGWLAAYSDAGDDEWIDITRNRPLVLGLGDDFVD